MGRLLPVVVCLLAVTPVRANTERESAHPAARAALTYFDSHHGGLPGLLQRVQPPALSPALRRHIIGNLPREGHLTPRARDAAKLTGMRRVLALHARSEIEARLITVDGQAFTGLHARSVLIFSREALDLLGAREVEAVTAHEIGHDYFWDEYEEARRRSDTRRLQEIELRCDGIAILTLHELGVSAEHLVAAITRLTRYNERIGATATAAQYVPLPHRLRFIRTIAARLAAPPQ